MRVLITGSRLWTDIQTMKDTFNAYFAENPFAEPPTLVSGNCPRGADALAEQLFEEKGYPVERYPADWSKGRSAGFDRNHQMVVTYPDVCFAFILDRSRGAMHCSQLAELASIRTIVVHQTSEP